jgi:alcohol dehydrogenase
VTLTAEERTMKGSYVGSCVPSRDIPRFIDMYKQGKLPIDKLLSGTIPLEQINEGFDRLSNGEVNRLVVLP